MAKVSFGSFLKELRLQRQLGLREFARKVKLLPSNFSNMEADKLPPPRSHQILIRIAKGLRLEENGKEWCTLFDLAARPGQIPADVQAYLTRIRALDQLPLMARTIKNKKLNKSQIQNLIRVIQKL